MKNVEKVSRIPKLIKIVFLILFCLITCFFLYTKVFQRKEYEPDSSLQAKIAEAAQAEPIQQSSGNWADTENRAAMEEAEESEEFYATSHNEEILEPLTNAPVKLSDIYAEKDSTVFFHCFYPDAVSYTWEIYDMKGGWQEAASENVTLGKDELNREVSSLQTLAKDNDGIMIRCTAEFETKDSIVDTASLHILEKIADISAEDFTYDSGQYISTRDIPVKITYQNGSKEEITGLSGIYFLESSESSEYSTVSGNMTETITTVKTYCDYFHMEPKEMEVTMRYQGKESIDIPIKLTGEDLSAPVIAGLTLSDYTISTVDKPVPVTVSIQAEDNSTLYPNLVYAFLPEGEEPEEDDWIKNPSFTIDITKNGKWIAYCKDESGNIGMFDKDIIAVDNKAPIVSVKLEKNFWCTENKIIVNATDGLSIEYNFSCVETGEESGWTAKNEYPVSKNSTWKIKVRDAVGNITEQEITVSNIDTQMPVIRNITEKKGEKINNED